MVVGVFGFGNRKGRDVYRTSLIFSAEHLLPMPTLDGSDGSLCSAESANSKGELG